MTPYNSLLPHVIVHAHKGYALYSVKHIPSGRLYVGSTAYLRQKLYWWHYTIAKPHARGKLPKRVRELLTSFGHDPNQWQWRLLTDQAPAHFNRFAKGELRPEWPYVAHLAKTTPDLVLNETEPSRRQIQAVAVRSKRGMMPRTYLGLRVGAIRQGPLHDHEPPHSWAISPAKLIEVVSPHVSFGSYLYRSLKTQHIAAPSREAIADLYREWLAHVPESERTAWRLSAEPGVPYTMDEALAVPLPRDYETRKPGPHIVKTPAKRPNTNLRSTEADLRAAEVRKQQLLAVTPTPLPPGMDDGGFDDNS